MIRRWLAQRRYKQALREAYYDRAQCLPWLQLAASLHHTQHPGEVREDCARCHPERFVALLEELSPLPEKVS